VSIAFIESHVVDYLNGGEAVSRDNFPKGRIYSLLDCDRKPFMVHLSGHNQAWEGLLRAAELDHLIGDPRFDTRKRRTDRHDEIVNILRAQFREKPREYWLSRLDANSIPNAPINTIHEVFDNPQIKHRAFQADYSSADGHQQSGWQSDQYVGYTAKVCSPGTITRGTHGRDFEQIRVQQRSNSGLAHNRSDLKERK
jgi:crotonobetainyl-CoA:carnitine CoA-transferase CaiB-like acyl-CoA transferase